MYFLFVLFLLEMPFDLSRKEIEFPSIVLESRVFEFLDEFYEIKYGDFKFHIRQIKN